MTHERIEGVYGWPVRIVEHPGPGPDRAFCARLGGEAAQNDVP